MGLWLHDDYKLLINFFNQKFVDLKVCEFRRSCNK